MDLDSVDLINFLTENNNKGIYVCLQVNLNNKNAKKTEFIICENPQLLEIKYYINEKNEDNLSSIIKNKGWKIIAAVGPFFDNVKANQFKLELETKSKGAKNRIQKIWTTFLHYKKEKKKDFSHLKIYITNENFFEAKEKQNLNIVGSHEKQKQQEKTNQENKNFHLNLLNQYFAILVDKGEDDKNKDELEQEFLLNEYYTAQKFDTDLKIQKHFYFYWKMKKLNSSIKIPPIIESEDQKNNEDELSYYLKNPRNIFTPTKFFISSSNDEFFQEMDTEDDGEEEEN